MRNVTIGLGVLLILGCLGFVLWIAAKIQTAGVIVDKFPTPYGSSVVCPFSQPVQVWADSNKNGLWDDDELPLQGVKVMVRQVIWYTSIIETSESSVSDAQGQINVQGKFAGLDIDGCGQELLFEPNLRNSGGQVTNLPKSKRSSTQPLLFGIKLSDASK